MTMPSHQPSLQLTCRRWRHLAVTLGLTMSILGVLHASPPNSSSPGADGPITEGADQSDTSAFMRAKLASSQAVLEGLVTEDFGLISKGARQMKKMSEAAEWPRAPDEVYDHYSEEFRRLAAKLTHLAAKENLEGASFTYMHMTSMCISCHKYVRGSLRVAEDPNGRPGGVRLIPSEWPD